MVIIKKINESYLKLICDLDELITISDQFTFTPKNVWFMKKNKPHWDGKIRLLSRDGLLGIGNYTKLINVIESNGYNYKVEGDIKTPIKVSDETLRAFIKYKLNIDCDQLASEGKLNLEQLEYQIDASLMTFENNKNIILLPTGAGKSFAQFLVSNFCLHNGFKKILIIVPTVNLVNQMEFDFLDYGKSISDYKDNIHKIYSGQEKNTSHPVHISTWQSARTFTKEHLASYDCIIVDECHSAESGKELASIISACTNAKIKLGMTGTLSGDKIKLEEVEALFGPVLRVTDRKTNKDIDTNLLIEKGILTDYEIKMLVFKYNDEDQKIFKDNLKRIKKTLEEKFPDGVPKKELQLAKYTYETEFLRENKFRTKKILQILGKLTGNSLVLFKNVEYGERLAELADKYLKHKKVYLIYGDIDKNERERIRQIIDTETDVVLVGSVQIVSTGINIKSLQNLMVVQGSKSRIKLFQSLGRLLRKFKGKATSKVIDIVDDINGKNFSYNHALLRLDMYKEQGSKYQIRDIQL